MSKLKVDFSKNFLRLKYSTEYNQLNFDDRSLRKNFIAYMDENLLKRDDLKVNCNQNTFSSIDNASKNFIESDFYMNMLESIGYSRNDDIIKNMKGFKKVDINYDEYCGGDKLLIHKVRRYPWEFVDANTPVCYIFKPHFRDEQYEYTLYVKFSTRGNEINVMSLHWDDYCHKEMPEKVFNYRTKEFDSIDKVNEFLEEKLNQYERER